MKNLITWFRLYLNGITNFNNLSADLEYGGYLNDKSKEDWSTIGFKWLILSNPHLPWYELIPELPTPPKGKYGDEKCTNVSLISKHPDVVLSLTYSLILLSLVNKYPDNGFSLLFI